MLYLDKQSAFWIVLDEDLVIITGDSLHKFLRMYLAGFEMNIKELENPPELNITFGKCPPDNWKDGQIHTKYNRSILMETVPEFIKFHDDLTNLDEANATIKKCNTTIKRLREKLQEARDLLKPRKITEEDLKRKISLYSDDND